MTRRVLGHSLTFLSALSLVLCLAVCVLWVRSYRVNETTAWYLNEWQGSRGRFGAWGVSSDSGGLLLFALSRKAHVAPARDGSDRLFKRANPDLSRPSYRREPPAGYPYMGGHYEGWGSLGFGFYAGQRSPPSWPMSHDDLFVVLPHWAAVLLAALPPARWALTVRRRRHEARRGRGLCLACAYNLTGNVSGTCPECGTPLARGAA